MWKVVLGLFLSFVAGLTAESSIRIVCARKVKPLCGTYLKDGTGYTLVASNGRSFTINEEVGGSFCLSLSKNLKFCSKVGEPFVTRIRGTTQTPFHSYKMEFDMEPLCCELDDNYCDLPNDCDVEEVDYELEDYIDSGFNKEFSEIAVAEASSELPQPNMFKLHVNVYIDPLWVKYHISENWAKDAAKQTIEHAADLLQHETLKTKFLLDYNDTIHMSSQHIDRRHIDEELLDELKPPFRVGNDNSYHVAHVYLTYPSSSNDKYLGVARFKSMCMDDSKAARLVVYWKINHSRTGLTVAHEIAHLLGIKHSFDPSFDENGEKIRDACISDEIPYKAGVAVMNYGQPRDIWSDCSNIDFKKYYETVVAKTKFCLESIGIVKEPVTRSRKCGSPQMCECLQKKNFCSTNSMCEVDCKSDCNDLFILKNKKCFSELACSHLLFEDNCKLTDQVTLTTTTTIKTSTTTTTTTTITTTTTTTTTSFLVQVSCGSHAADSCAGCTQGHGASWCNGECQWDNSERQCKYKPMDCVWGQWGDWSRCSVSCGGGLKTATRTIAQLPSGGGRQCTGLVEKSENCGMSPCPTDCVWGQWGDWSRCSASCPGDEAFAYSRQSAQRTVVQQELGVGKKCQGAKEKYKSCTIDCSETGEYQAPCGFLDFACKMAGSRDSFSG